MLRAVTTPIRRNLWMLQAASLKMPANVLPASAPIPGRQRRRDSGSAGASRCNSTLRDELVFLLQLLKQRVRAALQVIHIGHLPLKGTDPGRLIRVQFQ